MELAEIETEGVIRAFTTIVIGLLLTILGTEQAAEPVMINSTSELLIKEEVVNVVPFVPALAPLTCHWYVGVSPSFIGKAVNVTRAPKQTGELAVLMVTEGVIAGLRTSIKILL